MRKLSKKEAAALETRPPGRMAPLRAHLLNLEVGEALLIERSDWQQRRRSPSTMLRRMATRTGRDFDMRVMMNGTGWVVTRLL